MRIVLAILIACAAFGASLAGLLVLNGGFTLTDDDVDGSILVAVLLTVLIPSFLMIAGGVIAAPKAGLRSHVLDYVRGEAPPITGGWKSTAFIGFIACLLTVLVSAAIQVSSPQSFLAEEHWHETTVTDAIELAVDFLATGIVCWVGLLNLLAWACLKFFGTARRDLALATAVALMESLCWGLAAFLMIYLDDSFDLAMIAEGLVWSVATIVCAWLYVTRTLEHGILALMWLPVMILALRPLWDHLGI